VTPDLTGFTRLESSKYFELFLVLGTFFSGLVVLLNESYWALRRHPSSPTEHQSEYGRFALVRPRGNGPRSFRRHQVRSDPPFHFSTLLQRYTLGITVLFLWFRNHFTASFRLLARRSPFQVLTQEIVFVESLTPFFPMFPPLHCPRLAGVPICGVLAGCLPPR